LYKKNKLYFAANVTGSPTVAAGCPSTKNSRGALRWGLPGIFVRPGETENGGSTTLRIFRPQKATSHGGEQLAGARDAWRVRHELATPTPRPPPPHARYSRTFNQAANCFVPGASALFCKLYSFISQSYMVT